MARIPATTETAPAITRSDHGTTLGCSRSVDATRRSYGGPPPAASSDRDEAEVQTEATLRDDRTDHSHRGMGALRGARMLTDGFHPKERTLSETRRIARSDSSTVADMAVSVVVADDNLIVREGLSQLLAAEPAIRMVATCDTLSTLSQAIAEHEPDVVVTDIR